MLGMPYIVVQCFHGTLRHRKPKIDPGPDQNLELFAIEKGIFVSFLGVKILISNSNTLSCLERWKKIFLISDYQINCGIFSLLVKHWCIFCGSKIESYELLTAITEQGNDSAEEKKWKYTNTCVFQQHLNL